jgi:hypothetical protein
VSDYQAVYEGKLVENLRRYAAIRQRVRRRVAQVIADPYTSTEFFSDISGNRSSRYGWRSDCSNGVDTCTRPNLLLLA